MKYVTTAYVEIKVIVTYPSEFLMSGALLHEHYGLRKRDLRGRADGEVKGCNWKGSGSGFFNTVLLISNLSYYYFCGN